MDRYIENNLNFLKKNNPSIYEKLITIEDDTSINIIKSREGAPVPEITGTGRNIYIHSKFDPLKEAERIISQLKVFKYDLYLIFGFGFAYHIEELLKQIEIESTVLILEKNTAMIKAAVYNRDLSNLFSDSRVKLLVEPTEESIAELLKGKSSSRVAFITHRGSFQLDPEYYNNLRRISRSYISTKEVNIATLAKFEKTWSSNIARNIRRIVHFSGVNIFYDKFKGIPAMVIGAGPSLIDSIDFIKQNEKKSILIAVDTSYSILRSYGIEPHFCISVDPQLINSRYLEKDVENSTVLVADPLVHPSVFRFFKGKKVLTGLVFQMMKWIENISGEKGELAYGGSVSTNAYDFAKRIGASPIILVGQDLSFTSGYAHARGSYLDEQVHLRTYRFNNAEMFNRKQLKALPEIYVKGIRANKVHTNQKMMIFISWFSKRNDPNLINATLNGALLPNIEHRKFDDLNFGEIDFNIFSMSDNIYKEYSSKNEQKTEIYKKLLVKIQEISSELDSLIPSLEKAVNLSYELHSLIKNKTSDQGKIDYILKKLSETDKLVESKSSLKDMIGFTVQRVIHTITEGYDIDEDDASLTEEEKISKRSLYLYQGLLEGSNFNRKLLNKMNFLLKIDEHMVN